MTYNEIYRLSRKLKLGEYHSLVKDAFKLRLGKNKLKEENLFRNISLLNEFIEPKIIKYFEKYGNKIIEIIAAAQPPFKIRNYYKFE
ncbi:MAG: hypothetical protein ACTSPI_13725 [Candidatus Heimdallarchaeaceae archaeon]